MRKSLLSLMCLSLMTACGAEQAPLDMPETGSTPDTMGTDAAPLAALPKLRVNGRFLVKADGSPFFWMADTAWQLLPWLNRSEVQTYLDNRAERGFNVIQAVALGPQSGAYNNVYNDFPFVNFDYTKPNVTPGSDPNNATQYDYWDHVDYIINEAEARGIYTALLPTWGTLVKEGHITLAHAETYGRFLGSRYASKPIIWVLGGDVDPSGNEAVWRAMAKGIAIGVSGSEDYSKVLMTYHPKGGTKSATWFHNEPWLDFNMQQNGHCLNKDVWNHIASDYNRTPVKPTLDGEPLYEKIQICLRAGTGFSDDYEIRKYAYWSVFAGAFGHTYGHNSVWQMYAPGRKPAFEPQNYWYQGINDPGAMQMKYLRQLIESRPMLSRIPDQGVVASDASTGTHRIQATRDANGTYAFVYSSSGQAFTVNMSRLTGGTVRATWYNPRTGATTAIGTYANTGTRQFTPPSSGAKNDWVLILDDNTRNYPMPGGTTAPVTEAYTTQSASASPTSVAPGQTVNLSVAIRAAAAASGRNVKLTVRNASNTTVGELNFVNQSFGQGETKTYPFAFAVPSNLANGTYCVTAGVTNSAWSPWYLWDNCATSFTVSNAPAPTIGFTLVSATTSPTTVSRGGTVRLSSTFQANAAASGVNVKLDVRNSTGSSTLVDNPIANQSFTQGQSRTFQFDYTVPSTMAAGTYCLATGVSNSAWSTWYVWNSCATKFTVQ
ncbi:DUF4038 domain-containing protein [Archangium violaceum]|uniref:apiosidase-like domain-containing protein n=1 Tax=Archangium violaceum TaxID=83451 RepID=UPI00193C313F|nr:DUF4038 domain-containing protein [Archangium violaceum]QRK12545.1 DUF4038 domain-containing protein [Archangium violaceum]